MRDLEGAMRLAGGERPAAGGGGGEPPFKAALAYRSLTRFYDRFVGWPTRELALREIALRQADSAAREGATVLDVGCGTGTFALALARRRRDLTIVGVDADPEALAIAARKGEHARSSVQWRRGRAETLPFAAASFDAVTSSLFFHHLRPEAKVTVAREIRRVLAPGGELHVADWTAPRGLRRSFGFFLVQLLDGFATTQSHRRGDPAASLRAAGLQRVEATATLDAPLGTLGFWRATA